jgi:uncharacterized protein (TIGR00299 family) protein
VRCVYFECLSGAAGDMIIAAMLDAGMDVEVLRRELARLNLAGFRVEAEKVRRNGIAATHFHVLMLEHDHEHRHLHHVEKIIDASALSGRVKRDAKRVFGRLARAEADVHGTSVEEVHFHEVGAIDAIVDIVGAAICLEAMGIERVEVSPLRTGTGFVECAHGRLPVPAPATAELLKGYPTAPGDVEAELLTPTGAAVLTTLGERFGAMPAMTVSAVGYGAGTRDLGGTPNVLRAFVGECESRATADRVCVLETNIDDMPAELFEVLFERLFAAGALDVFTTSIQMKKGRPAVMLSVITGEDGRARAEEIIFRETTTFGVRSTVMDRRKLDRETVTVSTPLGELRVKLGRLDGEIVTVSPEYEDCRRTAAERNVPLKNVYDEARLAARRLRT